MANRFREFGLGGSSERREAGRPVVDRRLIDFALARRPGTSWQNLGRMSGVNAEDLRKACERFEAMGGRPPLDRHSPEHQVLAVIAQGNGKFVGIGRALDWDPREAARVCRDLEARKLVERAAAAIPYSMTLAGTAELARLGVA